MSCLTRDLQRKLVRYIKGNKELNTIGNPEQIRSALIGRGLCPSAVTADQVQSLINAAKH